MAFKEGTADDDVNLFRGFVDRVKKLDGAIDGNVFTPQEAAQELQEHFTALLDALKPKKEKVKAKA